MRLYTLAFFFATLLASTIVAHPASTEISTRLQPRQAPVDFHKNKNLWGKDKWCFFWCREHHVLPVLSPSPSPPLGTATSASGKETTKPNTHAGAQRDVVKRQAPVEFHKWKNLWGNGPWCFFWCVNSRSGNNRELVEEGFDPDEGENVASPILTAARKPIVAGKNDINGVEGEEVSESPHESQRLTARSLAEATPISTTPSDITLTFQVSITAPATAVDSNLSLLIAPSPTCFTEGALTHPNDAASLSRCGDTSVVSSTSGISGTASVTTPTPSSMGAGVLPSSSSSAAAAAGYLVYPFQIWGMAGTVISVTVLVML